MGLSAPVPTESGWTMAPAWLCPRQHPHQMVRSRPSPVPIPGPRTLLLAAPESPLALALPVTVPPAAPRPGTCNLQCFNGGSCFLNARRQPKCRCQPRYTGDKCELDQCWEHCRNGGTCAASPSGMAHSSPTGWLLGPGPAPHPLALPRANPLPPPSLASPLPPLMPPVPAPRVPALCCPPPARVLPALSLCSRAGSFSGPPSCSHVLSRQACPRAGAPQASRAPNAPSRCVRATVPTTAPALSTRATSPSADAYLASWVTAASTVSEPSLGPRGGEEGSGGLRA